jgi:hypothetical protein
MTVMDWNRERFGHKGGPTYQLEKEATSVYALLEAEVVDSLKQPRSDLLYFGHTFTFLCSGAEVEALRYKPGGRGIDSQWCHWNPSLT